MRVHAAVLGLALAASGAGLLASRPASAAEPRTLAAGGRTRVYRLYVPRSLPRDKPAALVLVFHGGEGEGATMERFVEFDALADREGFLVAYPDAVGKHWNDGREIAEFESFRDHVDDVAFVSALIDAIGKEHRIDPARVFATGISNGAIFSHYLAARLSTRIAAIAPVAGGIAEPFRSSFHADRPVSVLMMNGTEDPLVPYKGGGVRRGSHGAVLDTDSAARVWAEANGCAKDARVETLPDTDPHDACRAKRSRWTGGHEGTEVVLYTFEGGGHTWPGGRQYAPEILVGRVCHDVDATQVIWDFFKAHPRP
ncbi:MAG TPA: PHB depolymerase family esterase [Thermoanaerobaculia bacterium]